jgi:hypothetical protein
MQLQIMTIYTEGEESRDPTDKKKSKPEALRQHLHVLGFEHGICSAFP